MNVKELKELIKTIESKATSGNDIRVERIILNKPEFKKVIAALKLLLPFHVFDNE